MPDGQRRQTKIQRIPIFVISLASARLRRERICRHLNDLGLDYELIDAVDGRSLSADELAATVVPACRCSPGEIGCYMSHLRAYRRICETGAHAGLILEDDARLNPEFAAILKDGFPCDGFDFLFLDSADYNPKGPVFYDSRSPLALGRGFRSFPLSGGPELAHALIVTGEAAKRRLDCALPVMHPVDVYEHLPTRFRFAAVIGPKGAELGEDSLVSFTSARDMSANRPRFGQLRKTSLFRLVREYTRRERWQAVRIARQWQREGKLPPSGRWRPIPVSIMAEVTGAPLDVR